MTQSGRSATTTQIMNVRENIIDQLSVIASSARTLRYQNDVPYAQVGAELIEMWLKAPRVPGPTLDAAFDVAEQEAIATFHDVFTENLPNLPLDSSIKKLLKSKYWQNNQAQAQATLDVF